MASSLKIQELDPIEHILHRPDMYVGSVRSKMQEEYIAIKNEEDEESFYIVPEGEETKSPSPSRGKTSNYKIQKGNIVFPPALLRIFVEALSNAIDNVQRSREASVPVSKIKVFINQATGETKIWNDGLVIPIEFNEGSDEYKHTMIFGKLRTSTNFNDEEKRNVSGRNGLGIKLTNVFSSHFSVKGVDPVQGKMFFQEWQNNMKTITHVKISTCAQKIGFTEVAWIPDFKRFGMENYTPEIVQLYTRYVIDAAMLTGLKVYLNDQRIPVKNVLDYSKLFSSATDEHISLKSADSHVVLSSSTGEFEAISFVNGVFTIQGGKHVDGWMEAIFRPLVDHFNKPKKPQITIKDVKQFFRIFVVSTLANPEFSSQSKTELTSPDVQAHMDKKSLQHILKWEVTHRVNEIIAAKELMVMKKSEGKKRGHTVIEGYMPANESGGKKSLLCTLALCEGLSAKSFVVKGMNSPFLGDKGRDFFGVYPLRGKILNVRSANGKQIAENKEITSVIQALNLRYDVDYTKEENFSTLHYGKLLILTDADTDGKHITGLILNFFHHLFPSLLKRESPFIVSMLTPIAKFTLSTKEEKIFYDLVSADQFYLQHKDCIKSVKYYKGLGTHSDHEIMQEFGKKMLHFRFDDLAHDMVQKAFDKQYCDIRKQWVEEYDPLKITVLTDETTDRNISTFVREDLTTHSVDNCLRAIPHLMDGFKQSQRKIMYAAFLKNLTKPMKVAQFAGFVAEKTNYHHGEGNLYDTITKMAQDFVGSNNIPLFFREGQFGSRLQNGKDAANARYIFTKLENITRFIFRKEDDALLEHIVDDGDIVEPQFYVPIIPMILVNGCDGIGTGFASSVPLFNPKEIVEMVLFWIECSQQGKPFEGKELIPWYRGFKGTIEKEGPGKYTTFGVVERGEKKGRKETVTVTEIPIAMSIQDCYDMFMDLMHNQGKIKSFRDYSGADHPQFVIDEFMDGMKCSVKNLKLTSKLATTNMVLFDENGKIRKYESVGEIIDAFCKIRLAFYEKRKTNMIQNLEKKLRFLKNKMRFLMQVMNNEIIIHRRSEMEIVENLISQQYDKESEENDDKGYEYLLRLPVRFFTNEKIDELQKDIDTLSVELDAVVKESTCDMWKSELMEFDKKYMEFVKDLEKEQKQKYGKKSFK